MKKVRRVINKLLPKFQRRKRNSKEVLSIPVAGVSKDQIKIDPDEGVILVDVDEPILIEESDRMKPWKMYSSFGFSRSYFLPDGVHVREVSTEVYRKEIRIHV